MSFSVPRCRRPMCGSTRVTTSPSSSSTSRRTPCAAGCCGPKLIVKLRTCASGIGCFLLRFCARLLIAGKKVLSAFPGGEVVEGTKLLRQPHFLVDDAFPLVVVAHLDMAGKGKILTQRMAGKAIVGENSPEIGMAGKQNAIKVERLALIPVGGGKNLDDARHRRLLIGFDLYAHPMVPVGTQEM